MSGDGYEKYKDDLNKDGTLIYEKELVKPTLKKGQPAYAIPSTRIAEEIGRVIVQNIVMLGFFAAVTKLIPKDQWESAVRDSVPAGTEELNLRAFNAGWDYFEENYGEGEPAKEEKEEDEAEADKAEEEEVAAAGKE